jgi:hypothetical protein
VTPTSDDPTESATINPKSICLAPPLFSPSFSLFLLQRGAECQTCPPSGLRSLSSNASLKQWAGGGPSSSDGSPNNHQCDISTLIRSLSAPSSSLLRSSTYLPWCISFPFDLQTNPSVPGELPHFLSEPSTSSDPILIASLIPTHASTGQLPNISASFVFSPYFVPHPHGPLANTGQQHSMRLT